MHVRPRAVFLAVATVAGTLLALRVLESAGRVIGWLAMAAAAATVLSAPVRALDRRVPRGVAVATVALLALTSIAVMGYGVVGDVVAETRALRREAPRVAADIERSGRFAEVARDAHVVDRVERFVDEVPERLRGGTPAEAVRSATTRGLAFLAVAVLTLFFVLHGGALARGALAQIGDEHRRALVERIGGAVQARAFGYARGTLLMSAMAGGVAFTLARAAGVPAAVPLALWVALWDAVPLVGFVVGALPVVAFGAALSPTKGVLLAVAFVAWQIVEALFLQRPLEARTVRVGPFLTIAAGFAGVELYGIAGGLLAILAAAVGVVVLEEVAASRDRVPETHGDE